MTLKEMSWLQIFTTITSGIAVATAVWWSMDYTEVRPIIKREFNYSRAELNEQAKTLTAQLDQTNELLIAIQFKLLLQKREFGKLTFEELQELCRLAALLSYTAVPDCNTGFIEKKKWWKKVGELK